MFKFSLPKNTIFGENSIEELGKEAKKLGNRAFVMTYGKFGKTDLFKRVIDLLSAEGVKIVLFEDIERESSIQTIDKAAEMIKRENCDMVIGIGGGSILDTAKAASFLKTNPGSIRDYQLAKKMIENPPLDYIAIPTTAGTGSEATKVIVVSNKEERMKKSVAHPFLVPSVVILDPNLTISLPPAITASTGIDALSHCLEPYVSLNANPFTEAISLKGIELIGKNLERAYLDGNDIESRSNMLIASYLGGMSLNAGVGIGHILAQPISAVCGLSHGEAIALTLSLTMKVNLDYSLDKYALVTHSLGKKVERLNLKEQAKKSIEAVEELLNKVGMKKRFKDYSIKEDSFPAILESVRRSTSHIKTNPRPVDNNLLIEVLQMAL